MDDLNLAAMLSSRLCHDLVGPVGAIANGLEMLEDEGGHAMLDQAVDLLQHSAREASNRLQFYRMAFGASGGLDATIPTREITRVTTAIYENRKIGVTCDMPEGSLGQLPVRLVLNMAMIAAEALIRGGTLSVSVRRNGGGSGDLAGDIAGDLECRVTGRGPDAGVRDDVPDALSGAASVEDISTQSVQAYYAGRLAKALGCRIHLRDESGEVHLECRIPSGNLGPENG